MAETPPPVDPTRCPLCQGDNSCGVARGAGTCWCFAQAVSGDVVNRVPEAARGVACICERCASDRRSPTETREIIERLARDR